MEQDSIIIRQYNIKVSIQKEKNVVKEHIFMIMEINMKENLKIEIEMFME